MRITDKHLHILVDRLNKLTGSPVVSYDSDTRKANPGNFHIDYAYGGVKLCRMHTTGGGAIDIFNHGYSTKAQLYAAIDYYLAGIELGKTLKDATP